MGGKDRVERKKRIKRGEGGSVGQEEFNRRGMMKRGMGGWGIETVS